MPGLTDLLERNGVRLGALLSLVVLAIAVGFAAGMLRSDWREAVLSEVSGVYQTQAVADARQDLLDERLSGIKDDVSDVKQQMRDMRETTDQRLTRMEETLRELASKIH